MFKDKRSVTAAQVDLTNCGMWYSVSFLCPLSGFLSASLSAPISVQQFRRWVHFMAKLKSNCQSKQNFENVVHIMWVTHHNYIRWTCTKSPQKVYFMLCSIFFLLTQLMWWNSETVMCVCLSFVQITEQEKENYFLICSNDRAALLADVIKLYNNQVLVSFTCETKTGRRLEDEKNESWEFKQTSPDIYIYTVELWPYGQKAQPWLHQTKTHFPTCL